MIREDVYEQSLAPGDQICWSSKNQINAGKIASISKKGTIKVHPYRPDIRLYSRLVKRIKAWQIIKIIGIPSF